MRISAVTSRTTARTGLIASLRFADRSAADANAAPPREHGRTSTPTTRRMVLAAVIGALLGAAAYVPHLATGFASEDFVILAHLARENPSGTMRDELSAPWLGLESVGFWRPVSTILLALELRALGPDPARFHLLHLLFHALNALLVSLLVRRLLGPCGGGWIAPCVALLFAIHPLHPSAVLFTGAFATLHAATFSLFALWCFVSAPPNHAERGWRFPPRRDLAALAWFALALGSYEAAAALPAVLFVSALAVSGARTAGRRTLPFFAVLGAFLVLRAVVLGSAVGGYEDFRSRLVHDPEAWLGDLGRALVQLVHPSWEAGAGLPPAIVALAAVALATVGLSGALAATSRAPRAATEPSTNPGAALAGVAWAVLFLAPFGFVGLVPATGRYAYLAVAGMLLALAGLAAAADVRLGRAGAAVAAIALAAITADWLLLLRTHLDAHGRASALVAGVRSEVLRVAAATPDDVVLFIEEHPHFVSTATGAPLAKVLQYGLAESTMPPFGPSTQPVLPLPANVAPEARAALGALAGTARYRWSDAMGRLEPIIEARPRIAPLDLDGAGLAHGFLATTCSACDAARLVVVTATFPYAAAPADTEAGRARFAVPAAFLRGAARQRQGPAFLWIEERAAGRVVAMSPVARFALDADAPKSFAEAAAKIARRAAVAPAAGVVVNEEDGGSPLNR